MEGSAFVLVRLVHRRLARGLVSIAALVVLCATAGPAWSSFPGRNGEIAYMWVGESAYRAGPTATSIRAVDPRSGRVRVLHDCPLTADPQPVHTDCQVGTPRYSPDGLRIAFPTVQVIPHYTGEPWEFRPGLATMASDGTGLEVHATEKGSSRLAWSPAGDRFLLTHALPDYPNPSAVFVTSLDGTVLSQAAPPWSGAPDWSSTGQIAFVRDRSADPGCLQGCQDIFITRLGGTPRRLTYRGAISPSWSPHGTKLAFVSASQARPGEVNVYLVGRDGRGLRRLTRRGGQSPTWSPNGKWIAFIRDGDLYVVRTNGRGLRRLVNAPPADWEASHVASLDWQALPRR
jgi:Tol biopolymer transport system component